MTDRELGIKEPSRFGWWWKRVKHRIAMRLRYVADRLDGGDPRLHRTAYQISP